MNRRQRILLQRIFEDPLRNDVRWSAVENLIKALGGTVSNRSGSRRGLFLNGRVAVLHRPHPGNQVSKASLHDLRIFLENAGVTPAGDPDETED